MSRPSQIYLISNTTVRVQFFQSQLIRSDRFGFATSPQAVVVVPFNRQIAIPYLNGDTTHPLIILYVPMGMEVVQLNGDGVRKVSVPRVGSLYGFLLVGGVYRIRYISDVLENNASNVNNALPSIDQSGDTRSFFS